MVTSNCLLTALLSVATAYRVSNFMATYGRWRLLTRDLGCWLTRTQTNTYLSNSYLSQFVPNANPYPSQPIPNTNSYPNQLVPKSTHTQIRRQRRLLSWVRDGIGYGLALGTGWLGTIELTGKRDLYTPCSRVSFQMTLSDLVHLFITLLNWYELRLMVLYIQGGDMVRFTHILLNGGRKNLLFHFLTFQCRMQSLPMLNYLSQVFSYLLKSSVSK